MSTTGGPAKELVLVLKAIRHGETSRIATLFGMKSGRQAVLAKGARSGKAGAVGSALDPPCLAEMVIHFKSSRSVQLLAQSFVVDGFQSIKNDLELTAYASVVSELLYRGFTDGETNRSAFDSAVMALKQLDSGTLDPRYVLWEFLYGMAAALGFAIDPVNCPVCNKNPAEIGIHNLFWLDTGAICCQTCRPSDGNAVHLSGESAGLFRLLSRGGAFFARVKVSSASRSEITSVLLRHLKHHHQSYASLQSLDLLERLSS